MELHVTEMVLLPLSHGLVENICSIVGRVIERLVDDVPGVAKALVMANLTLNMRLNCGCQSGIGPSARRH